MSGSRRIFVALFSIMVLITPALIVGCSSANNEEVRPTVTQERTMLPSYDLTAVGMSLDDAKEAIVGLGFEYFVARKDGKVIRGAPSKDGVFLLDVAEGMVVEQSINGVFDFWDVVGLTQDEAESLVGSDGFESRVIVYDGQVLPTIPGRVVGRYNLSVTDGIVVGFMVEQVMLSEIWPAEEAD
jgi:hypothetical protein